MTAIDVQGSTPATNLDVATREYVLSLLPGLSTVAVDDRINANLAGKVLRSYVDSRDALNATAAYVAAGDATRVKTAQKDVGNGVLALGATGRAAAGRFNVASTQRWGAGVWTPSAYNGALTGVTAEQTVYPMTITDPGYAYKLVVYGTAEAATNTVGEYPAFVVRQGSVTGTVIASGHGSADSYTLPNTYTDNFNGGTLNSAKWATIPSTGKPNVVVDPGTNAIAPQVFSRNVSTWVGPTPTTDKMVVGCEMANIALGDCSIFMHVNTTFTSWVRLYLNRGGGGASGFIYTGGGNDMVGVTSRAGLNIGASDGDIRVGDRWTLDYDPATNRYTIRKNAIWTNGVPDAGSWRVDWQDTTNVVAHGVGCRGMALSTNDSIANSPFHGMGFDNFLALEPSSNPATSTVTFTPINYASQAVLTGATTLYVRAARSGSASQTSVTTFQPQLVAFAVPA